MKIYIDWSEIFADVNTIFSKCVGSNIIGVIGIGRGGLIPATLLSYKLNVNVINNFQVQSYGESTTAGEITNWQEPSKLFIENYLTKGKILIVDDLSDRGSTLKYVQNTLVTKYDADLLFATLYIKEKTQFMPDYYAKCYSQDTWLVFPWEV